MYLGSDAAKLMRVYRLVVQRPWMRKGVCLGQLVGWLGFIKSESGSNMLIKIPNMSTKILVVSVCEFYRDGGTCQYDLPF